MSPSTVPVPRVVRVALDGLAQSNWVRPGRIVAYPAGRLTQAMVQEGWFREFDLLAIADQDATLWGSRIGGAEVIAPETIVDLAPDAVVVCSTQFHQSIHSGLSARLLGTGIPVVDLCRDIKPHMSRDLEGQAARHGLALFDLGGGILCLREPGIGGRSMLAQDAHWSFLEWAIPQFDHFFHSIIPEPGPHGEASLDFARPGYHTYRNSGVRLYCPSVMQPESLLQLYVERAQVAPGETIIDLGAYNGDSSVFFAQAVGPRGRVVAVEADPVNFAALRRNVAELALENVILEPAAVWSEDGTGSFLLDGSATSGLVAGFDFGLGEATSGGTRIGTVPTLRLETVLRKHQVKRVDVLKLDTEGAELAILTSSLDLLREIHPRMVIEPHYSDHPEGIEEMIRLLTGAGFRTRWWEGDNLLLAQ